MKISEVIQQLEELAPLSLQESYDNAGLIVGDSNVTLNKALICLDSTEEVIEEAISNACNLVIAHHPIVFSGLKSLTGKNYIERTIIKAIKNDIAIYAIHTNLDNVKNGVNHRIASNIGLENLKILSTKKNLLKKLVFFCPTAEIDKLKTEIFKAGAGQIGEYDSCSFTVEGQGTFRAGENTKPFVGKKGEHHIEAESRIETILPITVEKQVISALLKHHPYEEVAYDLYPISNDWNEIGSGMIGNLPKAMDLHEFLDQLKVNLSTPLIRHTKDLNKKIKRVAVCGGSGSFLLKDAIRQKADIFVTSDYKYHQFFDAENKLVIADVGHYESEQFTSELLDEYLKEKIPNFASYLSKVNTNPINYR